MRPDSVWSCEAAGGCVTHCHLVRLDHPTDLSVPSIELWAEALLHRVQIVLVLAPSRRSRLTWPLPQRERRGNRRHHSPAGDSWGRVSASRNWWQEHRRREDHRAGDEGPVGELGVAAPPTCPWATVRSMAAAHAVVPTSMRRRRRTAARRTLQLLGGTNSGGDGHADENGFASVKDRLPGAVGCGRCGPRVRNRTFPRERWVRHSAGHDPDVPLLEQPF
jgi:hypothetical protein